MKKFAAIAFCLALALSSQAKAQSGAACPITPPNVQAANVSSYTLTNSDECTAIIFQSQVPVTVQVPSASRIAPGFQVMLIGIYNGLTVTAAGTDSTINSVPAQMVGPGQTGILMSSGSTRYWWGAGTGFQMTSAPVSPSTNGQTPGTTFSNSPIVSLPNGIIQITNPASVVPGGDALQVCNGVKVKGLGPVGKIAPTTPAWWQVLDFLGRPYKIPLC